MTGVKTVEIVEAGHSRDTQAHANKCLLAMSSSSSSSKVQSSPAAYAAAITVIADSSQEEPHDEGAGDAPEVIDVEDSESPPCHKRAAPKLSSKIEHFFKKRP